MTQTENPDNLAPDLVPSAPRKKPNRFCQFSSRVYHTGDAEKWSQKGSAFFNYSGEKLAGFRYIAGPSYYDDIASKDKLHGVDDSQRQNHWIRMLTTLVSFFLLFRIDYLFLEGYFRRHWFYYSFFVLNAFTLLAFGIVLAQQSIYDAISAAFGNANWVYISMGIGWFTQPVLLFLLLVDPIRKHWLKCLGGGNAIMVWEILCIWIYGLQMIAIVICCKCDTILPWGDDFPTIVSTVIGWLIVVASTAFKFVSVYVIGMDPCYFRDILLDKPETTYVKSFPYCFRWTKHPQYTTGKLFVFGFAMVGRSTLGMIFGAVLITLLMFPFVTFVEDPFVRKHYMKSNRSAAPTQTSEVEIDGSEAIKTPATLLEPLPSDGSFDRTTPTDEGEFSPGRLSPASVFSEDSDTSSQDYATPRNQV